jgi:hypothetical protein
MAKISADFKEKIKTLSREELEKLVLKAASGNKGFHDYLLVTHFDKESGEKDLFNAAINDLNVLFQKSYKGFSPILQTANMLAACSKRINEFSKVCKNKNLEADLVMYVLEIPFANTNKFGTCFTAFDHKVAMLLRRLITLVTKKMHEDYVIDYKEKINNYLSILHRTSNFNEFVNAMPARI